MSETITIEMMREQLSSAVVCDAMDQLGYAHQSPRKQFGLRTSQSVIVGRCKTTLWNEMFHADPNPYEKELLALDSSNPDDIFIAAAGGSLRSGIWGELLSFAGLNRGCVGAIVDGCVRDVRQMRAMGFPVWAVGTSPYDSRDRQRVVDMDIPVEIEGVVFSPGDLVIADADGIVVVPQKLEEEAIRKAWDKVHAENLVRDSIKDGMAATEVFARYGVL